jgi:LPS-assembly lipoprotein
VARNLALTAALLSSLALSACGFTPLYATPGVTPGLATIQIVAPRGRTAFLLGQALEDEFGADKKAAPAYKLTFTVAERIFPRGLNVNSTTASPPSVRRPRC